MTSATKALVIGSEGRTAEIDGAYFRGQIRPKNLTADRVDQRLSENQQGNRKVVVTSRRSGLRRPSFVHTIFRRLRMQATSSEPAGLFRRHRRLFVAAALGSFVAGITGVSVHTLESTGVLRRSWLRAPDSAEEATQQFVQQKAAE